jgi:hypothetical protein
MSQKQFKEMYGGLAEWNNSLIMAQEEKEEKKEKIEEKFEEKQLSEEETTALIAKMEAYPLETPELERVRDVLRDMDLVKYLLDMMNDGVESDDDLFEFGEEDFVTLRLTKPEVERFQEWQSNHAAKLKEEKRAKEEAAKIQAAIDQRNELKQEKEEIEATRKKIEEKKKKEEAEKLQKELEEIGRAHV